VYICSSALVTEILILRLLLDTSRAGVFLRLEKLSFTP
jgi:hypothetical protein